MKINRACAICGDALHVTTHSFLEVLRHEIRQDLDLVPDDERPMIVRDIYRTLLGTIREDTFVLGEADGRGAYTIDEALGGLKTYRLWRAANDCGSPSCAH